MSPRRATLARRASGNCLPPIGFSNLTVFDDDAFFVRTFGAFERAPVVIRLVRLNSRQQHLRAAFDARWSLD